MKPAIQYVKRKDGVRLAYSVFGQGSTLIYPAPWVTNLNFFTEDKDVFNFWNILSSKMKIVLYDKHGCGQSERNRNLFKFQDELADLETIVDNLKLDRFTLFGVSMAGPTAIAYAAKYPYKVKGLILYGTYANGENLASKDLQDAIISMVKAHWGLGSKALADIFIPNATTDQIQKFAKFMRSSATPEMAAKLLALTYEINVIDILGNIEVPTLVLHKKKDKVVSIEHGKYIAQNIINSQIKILGGEYHFPFYEEPEQIINEIVEFNNWNDNIGTESKENDHTSHIEQSTIVFTDIVSSTNIVTKIGDAAARDLFVKHDNIIKKIVERFRGRVLQNLGDGFMLSFQSASSAIDFSCALKNEFKVNLPTIQLKIGINTGEVVIREGKHPFGQAVVIASRITNKVGGGQIFVSDVTKKMVAGSLFNFDYKGAFKLKGIKEKIGIYEVLCKDE